MKVFKFGGASVKDADGVKNVAKVLNQVGYKDTVVIVSAMGKTTNALELVVDIILIHKATFQFNFRIETVSFGRCK